MRIRLMMAAAGLVVGTAIGTPIGLAIRSEVHSNRNVTMYEDGSGAGVVDGTPVRFCLPEWPCDDSTFSSSAVLDPTQVHDAR